MITRPQRAISALLLVWVPLVLGLSAWAQAPDATISGPLTTTSAEYRFPAAVDPPVTPTQATEVWASLYRPSVLQPSTRYPLIVFLHGNHATCGFGSNPRRDTNCQYTTTGTCPAGFVVVPNHAGYAYLAENLASWGYLVVSINANRGINCRNDGPLGDRAMNLARGRLILRHLQKLSEWNNVADTTPDSLGLGTSGLLGKIDFSNVGIMGHSRGGEGARAAHNLYPHAAIPITDPVSIKAIFEIGAVDGQTSMVLDARDTVWNQLLPACDGDVSNLQGVRPFDRMMLNRAETNPSQKSTYFVYGANHNFYNTEWQQSDQTSCAGFENPQLWTPGAIGSEEQQQTALASVAALFRGNLVSPAPGAYDPNFNQNFNPQNALVQPPTKVKRGYTNSPDPSVTGDCDNAIMEDFDQATGTSSCGVANCEGGALTITHGTNIVPNHAPTQPAARISWDKAASWSTNSKPPGSAVDISGWSTLDFRISRQSSALNPDTPTDFRISLVQDNGTECGSFSGSVNLIAYLDPLEGPVGGPLLRGGLHPILQTVRIPLSDFPDANLTNVRGVRFDFTGTETGAIYVANIRLSSVNGPGTDPSEGLRVDLPNVVNPADTAVESVTVDAISVINGVRNVRTAPALGNRPGFEIEVASEREFPVRALLPALKIGDQEFLLSRYPDDGDTHKLIFTLTSDEYARAKEGDPVMLGYQGDATNARWDFGLLEKR